jgi:tetratricopeptide (TPR) repeat protein
MKCETCEAVSELEFGFVQVPGAAKSKKKTLCLTCFQYDTSHKRSRGFQVFLVALAASVLPVLVADSWTFFNFMLFYVGLYLSIVPHELGHALGAILTGQKILQITFGSGPALWLKKLRGIYLEIRAYPTEGIVFRKYIGSFTKLRDFIVVLAGPLTNLGIAWFLWFAFGEQLEHTSPFDGPAPLLALFCANLLVGFLNLLPFSNLSAFGPLPSDGKQLLSIPFLSKALMEKRRLDHLRAPAMLAILHNDFTLCDRISTEGLSFHPSDLQLITAKAVALCSLGDRAGGREWTLKALETLNDNPAAGMEKAVVENNIAWCVYLLDARDLLDEADRLSESAMALMPWALSVRSTRGAILIAKGETDSGIALLDDQRFGIESKSSQALAACSLGIGYFAQGKPEKAIEALRRAEALDPECILLERARAALGQTKDLLPLNPPRNAA